MDMSHASHAMGGMDMSGMTSTTNDTMPTMMMYFNGKLPTMPLWFDGWLPKSAGTTFAACLGLFGLAVLSKLLGALRHQASIAWSMARTHEHFTSLNTEKANEQGHTVRGSINNQASQVGPWIAEHEIPRGILASVHLAIEYFLMLAVMTFNVYFFIAIIFGAFAGEVGFGRWTASSPGSGHSH